MKANDANGKKQKQTHDTTQKNRIQQTSGESCEECAEGVKVVEQVGKTSTEDSWKKRQETGDIETQGHKASGKSRIENRSQDANKCEQSQKDTGKKNKEDNSGHKAIHEVGKAKHRASSAKREEGNQGTEETAIRTRANQKTSTEGSREGENQKRVRRRGFTGRGGAG